MESLINTINSTTPNNLDVPTRQSLLAASRALVSRLEQPWERVYALAYVAPGVMTAMKIAHDLKVFQHLSPTQPTPLSELAKATNCDPILLHRILRVLVCSQWLDQTDDGSYLANEHSTAMADPKGLIHGIELIYASGMQINAKLPAYLATHNYQNPTSYDKAPWKWCHDIPEDSPITRWEHMDSHGGTEHLAYFLSALREKQRPLAEVYDFTPMLNGYDPKTPFLVDVGGGQGRDISHVAEFLATTSHPSAPLVLQDRPGTLPSPSQVPKTVTPLAHDFFTPQPIKNARIYFLRSVLHDWPDAEARSILQNIKTAMKPGYSRILLAERIMPEKSDGRALYGATMDLNMMSHFGALERTAKQWQDLIESVGLKFLGIDEKARDAHAYIEAEL